MATFLPLDTFSWERPQQEWRLPSDQPVLIVTTSCCCPRDQLSWLPAACCRPKYTTLWLHAHGPYFIFSTGNWWRTPYFVRILFYSCQRTISKRLEIFTIDHVYLCTRLDDSYGIWCWESSDIIALVSCLLLLVKLLLLLLYLHYSNSWLGLLYRFTWLYSIWAVWLLYILAISHSMDQLFIHLSFAS